MNDIVPIIKNTLEVLKTTKTPVTPKAYEKEFFAQAQINGGADELTTINTILESLSDDEKNIVRKEKITTYYELVELLLRRISDSDISRFIKHLKFIMSPSLDNSFVEEIENIVNKISKNPKKLTQNASINELNILSKKRIALDKNLLSDKTQDIKKIFGLIGIYLNKSLIQSRNTNEEIYRIKNELESLNLSSDSSRELVPIHAKLVETVSKLENSLAKNQIDLIKGQENHTVLEEKIEKLENDLSSLNKERYTDYLTGVLNRRAFDNEIVKIENEYNIFDSQYAIVFYDLDHFKHINDEYGHDCGDTILKNFASLLNKLTRVDDVVTRYGGEEFVVLVHYKKEEEIVRYVKRVKNIISNNSFVYKDDLIKVKFSAGVTFRKDYKSSEETIMAADKFLYKAKEEGRDKIVMSSGIIH